jgi:glycosyltransferase involved in cell wall biosynthesis
MQTGRLNRLLTPLVTSARYVFALAAVDRMHPIDVVEFSNWSAPGFVHSVIRPRPQVTRISTTGWQSREIGPTPERAWFGAIADRWRDWIEAFPIRHSDLVLAHTSEHAYAVDRRLRLRTIPEVRPLGTSQVAPSSSDAGAQSRQDLLFVGNLGPRKGFDTLIDAFVRACPRLPSGARLVVAGSDTSPRSDQGSYSEKVLATAPPAIRARIDLLGWVSDETLDRLYRSCAVVVVPSRYESFGLPCIEAMQHGRAVIATTVGGMPEVVTNGVEGVLIPPGDIRGLADAMTRVVTESSFRGALERSAQARYERDFTKDAFAARAEQDYRRVMVTSSRWSLSRPIHQCVHALSSLTP